MEDDWANEKIDAWVKQGALTKEGIVARLNARINSSYAIHDEEKLVLDGIFGSLGTHNNRSSSDASLLTESTFISLLQSKAKLPSSAEGSLAGKIIYHSIASLSTLPFLSKNESNPFGIIPYSSQGLSRDEIVRGLVWALPDRAKSFIEEGPDACFRTGTDHHRLIFQSLATPIRKHPQNDFELAHSSKLDSDEDDIYHDLLDVLYSTQEITHPGHSPVHRDTFRPIAKRIGAENDIASLHELAIPIDRFEILAKLLLAMQFEPPADLSGFSNAARALGACFSQDQGGSGVSMITWPMFERGLRNDAPYLFAPFYRLLSTTFLGKSSTIDVLDASEVPPSLERGAVILTRPLQSQLSTFLAASVYFGWFYRTHHFTITDVDAPTPAALISAIQAAPDEAVLVISGTLESGEPCTFGLFTPQPRSDATSIQTEVNPHNAGQERCGLFQLEPTHGVFKGVVGRPGWSIADDGGSVTFGRGGGMVLALGDGLRQAVVRHQTGEEEDDTVSYAASTWRGDWLIEFDVTSIEIWSEREL
ncbi:hypothetical protein GQX73_g6027 [Xylaria multiplex]|uniref:TLDc domain-containing protein n=1 Tax=Xylaria multiplex TaxID=323545 RepID=A0A7C8MWS8_9PEZI|nr:hypothetical protein GQX73_g6027 [Xylaria multiplex]